jgi:conjugative relaxase-like TrwC/TraI family protein
VATGAGVRRGHDARYPGDQVAPELAEAMKMQGAGYYRAAVEAGEPPGRWWGPGAEAIGLEPGSVIDHDVHAALFEEHIAPDGTKLGRVPVARDKDGNPRPRLSPDDVYARLKAAEPHADQARLRELRAQAQRSGRTVVLYYDATFHESKSVSVFHASLGANLHDAEERGDAEDAARWAQAIEDFDAAYQAANDAALAYLQREAGYVRTGTHAGRVGGRETGKFEPADLIVASWYQHTSRDGDPHLHFHNQIAHLARTRSDGKWRAPFNRGYYDHIRAAAEVFAAHFESALTRRFGLEWIPRADGRGYEIKGISQAVIDAFSSRRDDVEAYVQDTLLPQFVTSHGRKPSQAEMAALNRQASVDTRRAKHPGVIDWAQTRAEWVARLAATVGADLASVARGVMPGRAQRDAGAERGAQAQRDADTGRIAIMAVAAAQQEKASWTRADLITHLGRLMPRGVGDPAAEAALLEELADRALASEFGPVTCLDAPDVVAMPERLIREDGCSVYRRHGVARYATKSQTNMEQRLVQMAGADGAPALDLEFVARELGATVEDLDAALAGTATEASATITGCGLRLDQAAAVFEALTSRQRVSLINAAAGSGKTTMAAQAGRIWEAAGRQVVGVTPSQASRNVLAAAGVRDSHNFANFLGHLPGRRGARGPVQFGRRTLIVGDEAGMFATDDLHDIEALGTARDSKILLVLDTEQLTAVERGGGALLVAHDLGYNQVHEPVRFKAKWERAASLRLRAGDVSVLARYADHGRLRAGPLEEILDDAARAYTARTLRHQDVLMIVQDHGTRLELNRRVRGELRHLGLVDPGREARIADGQRASAGDLVLCQDNDNRQMVDDTRPLANGDLFRVEAVDNRGRMTLREVLRDPDPETGMRALSRYKFTYEGKSPFTLGYAVTQVCAQGRTVQAGMDVVTGSERRQGEYVAASRGTDLNEFYIAVPDPKAADPRPGARPAPEIERARRLESQHQGRTAIPGDGRLSQARAAEQLAAAQAVLADTFERDGAELSAIEYQRRELANADHLGILLAMWEGESWQARDRRYEGMVMAELPVGYDGELSPARRWLYRTLHSAELAGLDPQLVLRDAIASGDLAGSRDVAKVLHARIRKQVGPAVPLPSRPWAEQVPKSASGEVRAFLEDVGQAADERIARLGEHYAESAEPWAVAAFGPVPDHPADRLEWEAKASAVGAYREAYSHDDPDELIGPEPTAAESPRKRAMWHDALRALGPIDGLDLRGRTDGQLWLLRRSYETETAWAPRYVAETLGLVRRSAEDASLSVTRSEAEADAAGTRGDTAAAERHRQRAAASRAKEAVFRRQEGLLAKTDADYREHQAATDAQKRNAIAAEMELRRRHPERHIEPLRDAGPAAVSEEEHAQAVRGDKIPEWVTRLEEAREAFTAETEARQNVMVPGEDHEWEPEGEAFPGPPGKDPDAILVPPKPEMPPSERVIERQRERDMEAEASA